MAQPGGRDPNICGLLWLSGQFLITQAAALLTFAGNWAMARGATLSVATFFTMRSVADAMPTE